jgi:RNA polymerase sigma-70 factor (ECF subfamily)
MKNMEYSQSALVERIKNKDVIAYEYIINKYTKIIYCLAYNILHGSLSKEDIEECTSDVFFDAWTKINEFDCEKGSFKTWLLILTKYKAFTYKRKKKVIYFTDIEEINIQDNYNLEQEFLLKQDQEKVINVINSFNKMDKEIFLRRYFLNEKISDLANNFHLSRSAIDNRLLRGRKIIREVMGNE